jgi:aminopeptidase N
MPELGFLGLKGNKMTRWFLLVNCFLSLAGFSQDIDVLHYQYAIELNDHNDTFVGEAGIRFVQLSNTKTVTFDLTAVNKEGKGMKVFSVNSGFDSSTQHYFTQAGERLTIELPKARKGDTVDLRISYKGVPDDGLIIGRNKYGEKTFFADNWPNRAHHWVPCNDQLNDKATFGFDVTAPAEYSVISNGVKTSEVLLPGGKKKTIWIERVSLPTKVMVIGVARFAVKTYADSPVGIPVSAWVYRQDSAKGFHDYAPATGIVKFFSSYVAPFPYEKLANVQSKTIFGGMENASAIFYFEGSVTGRNEVEDLLAHEIAHQWFGDMASEKSFPHLWLSEGFATYLTDIYWQYKYGEKDFVKRLQEERREVVEFVKLNNHPVVDSLSPFMDLLNANSYQKGGWVLHMLRNEVGDSTFHKIIQSYYQGYKGGNADTRNFEAVAEKVSGRDLKWFFDQWLYLPGIPKLTVEWKLDGKEIKVNLKQTTSQAYRFPLEVGLVSSDGKMVVEKFTVTSKDNEVKIETPFTPARLILDPSTNLLFEGSVVRK